MPTALLPAVVLLTACTSGGADPESGSAPSAGAPEIGHVHAVAVDPADDALLLATHAGLFRVADGQPACVDLPQPMGLIESTDGGSTWSPVSRQGRSDFHALTASSAGVLGYDGSLLRSSDGRAWEQLAIPDEPHALAASHLDQQRRRGLLGRGREQGSAPHAVVISASTDGLPRITAVTGSAVLGSTDGGRTFVVVLEY